MVKKEGKNLKHSHAKLSVKCHTYGYVIKILDLAFQEDKVYVILQQDFVVGHP